MQFTVKTDHRLWRGSPLSVRYSFSRDDRDLPFPVRGRNLPGFGISVLDQGHNFGARHHPASSARIVQRAPPRPERAASRQRAAERRHQQLRRARHHRPAARRASISGFPDAGRAPATRRSATIRTCRCSRRHAHVAPVRRADVRSRTASPEDRRRVARLSVRRLQPSVRARAGDVSAAPSPASRSPICCSASRPCTLLARQRQPPGAAHLGGRTGSCRTTGASRRALTINAGVRYEFNAPPYDADNRMRDPRPVDAAAAAGRRERRAALGPATATSTTSRRASASAGT